ncbi:MAG: hypothetical protein GX567_09120 [Clostridia bacterium]|nr:hypothetical protein [Clostridia bacterium]
MNRVDESYGSLFERILNGESVISFEAMIKQLPQLIFHEWMEQKQLFAALFAVLLLSVIISGIDLSMNHKQVSDIVYYATGISLISLITLSMSQTIEFVTATLEHLTGFTHTAIPAYLLCVSAVSGAKTASAFYAAALFTIGLIETLFLVIIVPLIQIYMITALLDLLLRGLFTQLLSLLKSVIQFCLKSSMAGVVCIQAIQGMVTPVLSSIKAGTFLRAVSAIPGIQGISDTVFDTVAGSAVIIKNAMGMTTMLILLMIMLNPIVKLLTLIILYRLIAAFAGLFAEKEMAGCLHEIAEGSSMLFKTIVTSMGLLMITIAIISFTTNRGF